jgi:hypothetical protein
MCLKLIALLAVSVSTLVCESRSEEKAERGCEDGKEATTRKERAQVTTDIKYAKHYLLIINRGIQKQLIPHHPLFIM